MQSILASSSVRLYATSSEAAQIAYLTSLGFNGLVPVPLKQPNQQRVGFRVSSFQDNTGIEPFKFSIKGSKVLTFPIKDKGYVQYFEATKLVVLEDTSRHCPLIGMGEMRLLLKEFGVKTIRYIEITAREEQFWHVRVALKNELAQGIVGQAVNKYKAMPSGGRATGRGSNYQWSSYRFVHPHFGGVQVFVDHRPSFSSNLTAFNTRTFTE